MSDKIYAIHAKIDRSLDMGTNLGRVFQLDADVQRMALAEGASIHMHQYADDTLGGWPHILVECDKEFIDKVKRHPLFERAEIHTGEATIRRSDALQVEPPEAIGKPAAKKRGPRP